MVIKSRIKERKKITTHKDTENWRGQKREFGNGVGRSGASELEEWKVGKSTWTVGLQ